MEWIVLLLAIVPMDPAIVDSVDVAEVNHFYDYEGELVFSQVIWKRWQGTYHEIVDWRLLKPGGLTAARDKAIWVENGELRIVRHGSKVTSWTQFDPELRDREWMPTERRRLLSTRRK